MTNEVIKNYFQFKVKYEELKNEYEALISQFSSDEYNRFSAYEKHLKTRAHRGGDEAYKYISSFLWSEQEKNDLKNPPEQFIKCNQINNEYEKAYQNFKNYFVNTFVPTMVKAVKNKEIDAFPFVVTAEGSMDYDSSNFGGLAHAQLSFSSTDFGALKFLHDVDIEPVSELDDIITLTKYLRYILPDINKFAENMLDFEPRFKVQPDEEHIFNV